MPFPLPVRIYGPTPELGPDEQWLAHLRANRVQRRRVVGGSLHVSTQRLVFHPNVVDMRLAGRPWQCAVADVARVGMLGRQWSLREVFRGGFVDRLRVDLHDGVIERFVVTDPGYWANELGWLLGVEVADVDLPVARVVR